LKCDRASNGESICKAAARIMTLPTILAVFLLIYASCAVASTKMPAFVLPSVVDGNEISSSAFKEKTLLVTFFATWCAPCVQEVPTLVKLQEKYGKDTFSVIGLSVDRSSPRVVKRFVEKHNITYPVLMATAETMQDFGGVYGIPATFLINKKGNVVKKYPGYIPQSVLEKDLKKIL